MLEAARGWGGGWGDFSWCLLLCCNSHGSKLFIKTFYTVSVQPEVGACSHMHEHLSARELSQERIDIMHLSVKAHKASSNGQRL